MKRANYIFQDIILDSKMKRKILVRLYVFLIFRISIVSIVEKKKTSWNLRFMEEFI